MVDCCEDLGEGVVIVAAEEGEGGDQGAGADPGDKLEARPVAALAPTNQQPRPERAVVATAGQGEEARGRQVSA